MGSLTKWDHAVKLAFEAYEGSLRSGATSEWAVTVAIAQMRTMVTTATESDVRQCISILLAEKRMAERTVSGAAATVPANASAPSD